MAHGSPAGEAGGAGPRLGSHTAQQSSGGLAGSPWLLELLGRQPSSEENTPEEAGGQAGKGMGAPSLGRRPHLCADGLGLLQASPGLMPQGSSVLL